MRMQEGEHIVQYCSRIKDVDAIRGDIVKIDDDIVLRIFLRTLLLIYAIRVSTTQELSCVPGNDLTLEGLVDRLTIFEQPNFDSYKPKHIESTLKANLSLKEPDEKEKKNKKR